jgi:hypothetical protein
MATLQRRVWSSSNAARSSRAVASPRSTPPHDHSDLAASECQATRARDIVLRACAEIIARFPGFALAYALRGNAYRLQQEPERALSDLGKALELEPQNTFALARRILVLTDTVADGKAQADFDRLLGN